jgi:hypothetical protein
MANKEKQMTCKTYQIKGYTIEIKKRNTAVFSIISMVYYQKISKSIIKRSCDNSKTSLKKEKKYCFFQNLCHNQWT